MTAAAPVLLMQQHDAVRVLRLNRPEASNAMNGALVVALGEALIAAEADDAVRALVLTGSGERAFCAGMDLRAFAAGEVGFTDEASAPARAAVGRLQRGELAKPVIGGANGSAVAGGLELLLGCDLIVASADARFGLPEVKRGLFAARGGMTLGTRLPLARALELVLTGALIDAAQAERWGLVNRVVSAGDVLREALALAAAIAANAPLAVAASRELVRLHVADPAAAAARQREWETRVFTSADAREGAAAFVAKRAPVWRGP